MDITIVLYAEIRSATILQLNEVRGAKFGAGEGIRTLDFNLGKVALYP